MGEWGGARERPLHPSQLGSLSRRLVGGDIRGYSFNSVHYRTLDKAETPQIQRCFLLEQQLLNP